METLFLHKRWDPLSLCVFLKQVFLNVSHFNEPTVKSSVDKGGLRAPAEGVAMLNCSAGQQSTRRFEICSDNLVSVLDILACVSADFGCKFAVLVNRHWRLALLDQPVFDARVVILLTEAGRLVDHACA
jgi:hypothetical protein